MCCHPPVAGQGIDLIYRQITVNDLPVGRSVEETIRLIKAFQFTVSFLTRSLQINVSYLLQEKYGEVCPVNWSEGSATIKADPKGSLEYFSSANPSPNDDSANKKRRLDSDA